MTMSYDNDWTKRWDEKQGCFVPKLASSCTCGLHCSADYFRKIRNCIGLLNSMVRSGERHSDTSARMVVEALEAVERMEQPNATHDGRRIRRTDDPIVGSSSDGTE